MNTAQLKALVKKSGLSVSAQKAVGFTRAAKRTTQGIEFDWKDGAHTFAARKEADRYTVNETAQTLWLVSVPREGVLTSASEWAEKQADEDADKLSRVLREAGISFERDGKNPRAFCLPDFVRVYEEWWGHRINGTNAHYPKRNLYRYPETVEA
jgi:hypothetical protein